MISIRSFPFFLTVCLAIFLASFSTARADQPDQLARGKEMFRIRCEPCHGDVGQGLALWRYTWAPEDQNCSQYKCHALNHPPDGFYMPNDAPPIIGKNTLLPYRTARELYSYVSQRMPFDKPGELSPDDYWAVVAFLLQQNGKLPEGIRLEASTAASIVINPNLQIHPELTPVSPLVAPLPVDPTPFVIVVILVIGVGAAWVLVHLRRRV